MGKTIMAMTAYIDEAGSLPDPQSRYVVVAAVATTDVRPLRRIIRKAGHKLKKSHFKKRGGQEVKWWNAPDGTRIRVLQAIARQDVHIFWIAVDKQSRSIADTPENYGLMVGELVQECLAYHPNLTLFIDAHFNVAVRRDQFNRILTDRFHVPGMPVHLDSQSDAIIQLADFVAGAILYKMTGRDSFASIIEEKVIVGKVVKWTYLRQKRTVETPGGSLPDTSGEPL